MHATASESMLVKSGLAPASHDTESATAPGSNAADRDKHEQGDIVGDEDVGVEIADPKVYFYEAGASKIRCALIYYNHNMRARVLYHDVAGVYNHM